MEMSHTRILEPHYSVKGYENLEIRLNNTDDYYPRSDLVSGLSEDNKMTTPNARLFLKILEVDFVLSPCCGLCKDNVLDSLDDCSLD